MSVYTYILAIAHMSTVANPNPLMYTADYTVRRKKT